MATTVQVKNISFDKSDKEIKDFFSFCGKIASIDITTGEKTKSATVKFEKDTAARTALLLNNTNFGDSEIEVTGEAGGAEEEHKDAGERENDEITQEEKPRSRILAEYLAHGYVVADAGLKSAIALDEKHGVSQRFLGTLQSLDSKYHATDRAKTVDQSYGVTQRANNLLTGLHSYFEKATNTPTGQRIVQFYTSGQRQVSDIHKEAIRLAELKTQEAGGSSYKAAGLHRVFGQEKADSADAPGAAPADAAATESATQPTAPSTVPGNTETHTQIPKA